MLRHEGGSDPANLRILRARGDSMEPLVGEGDRLIVDISHRAPSTGEMAVLWDGLGLVVKRVDAVAGSEPAELLLISANPNYGPDAILAEDAHVVGKVVWVFRKA